jgi:hypothetical protein
MSHVTITDYNKMVVSMVSMKYGCPYFVAVWCGCNRV